MKLSFENTNTAFAYKTDAQLKKALWLFTLMRHLPHLTVYLAQIGNTALKWKLPLVRPLIKSLFFDHFCGGETLEKCEPTVQKLSNYQIDVALDIGVEAQQSEKAWQSMTKLIIDTILHASTRPSIPVISLKVTAIGSFELLEKYSSDLSLTEQETGQWQQLQGRLDLICSVASRANRSLYIDAEESWIQPALDALIMPMMVRYNQGKAVVFNTYQLYLKSSSGRLLSHHQKCVKNRAILGAKLVRGAYLEKEKQRARLLGLDPPVQPSKKATDHAYDHAVTFCLEHLRDTAICLATHNEESHQKAINQIKKLNLDTSRIHFCQLFGMSDHITFELAKRNFMVLKYLPFGKLEETFPYLVRRAEENTSVTKDAALEVNRIKAELKRRKKQRAN
ncbi:MAG: proline dehydrogenase family protein [Marinoscillum sp.]